MVAERESIVFIERATPDELRNLFDRADADGSGWIDAAEFEGLLDEMGVTLPTEQVETLTQAFSEDADGKIIFDEFTEVRRCAATTRPCI